MIESAQFLDTPPAQPRLQRADCEAMIRRFRPELAAESAEFRGAVLLLLVDAYGVNVERLVRRSGQDRTFVARGVRRLIDNGWMVESSTSPRWCPTPPDCRHFWLDVEVLLGLSHRRVGDDGTPEWARAGEWVKEFEYQGPRHERLEIHNEYRSFVPHDPEPDFGVEGEVESGVPERSAGTAALVATPALFGVEEPREREARVAPSGFLGGLPAGELLGSPTRPAPAKGSGNDAGLLVGEWSSAQWLS